MKRLTALLAGLATGAVVALTPGAALAAPDRAVSHLAEYRDSGVTAIILFEDTGSELIVQGRAWGLDPDEVYLSLIYDNGSIPDGTYACEPSPPDAGFNQLTFDQMLLGQWTHVGDGQGVLKVVKTGTGYAGLDEFVTVSIRQLIGPPPPPPQPPPNKRVACGEVVSV